MVEHRKIQLIRPPVADRPRPAALRSRSRDCGVLAFAGTSRVFLVRHVDPRSVWGAERAGVDAGPQLLDLSSRRFLRKTFSIPDNIRPVAIAFPLPGLVQFAPINSAYMS